MSDAPPPPVPPRAAPARAGLAPWLPLLVVLVAWAAHGGVLRNGWVWDDAIVVRDDPVVAKGLSAVPTLWTRPWGGDAHDVGLFRPMVAVSLAVEAALHGTSDPFGFHLTNLFLHGLAAVIVLAALARWMPARPVVASCAALLFAAHPTHAGVVSWIVARGDVLVVVFGGLAALAWRRDDAPTVPNVALAALALFFALLSKEEALAVPVALVALDVGARREGFVGALRRRWWAYAALAVPVLAWWVLRRAAVGGLDATASDAVLADRNLVERLMIGCGALVRVAWRLLVPVGLTGDGSGDPVLRRGADLPWAYAASAALVALVLGWAAWLAIRRRVGALPGALALFVLLSLPVLQIVPLGAVFEDRFGYVPSTAFLVVPALAAAAVAARLPRRLAAALGLAVLALSCAASWAVAADWRDDRSFDESILRDDPDHVRALGRLGRTLLVAARADRDRAASIPAVPATQAERAALLARANASNDEAIRRLERARALPAGRRDPSVLRVLGDAYLSASEPRHADAEDAYRDVLGTKRVRLRGRRVPVARVAEEDIDGVLRADRIFVADTLGNRSKAVAGLQEGERAANYAAWAAKWDPWSFDRQRLAGSAWMRLSHPTFALPYLEAAARLAPADERDEARRQYENARTLVREQSDEHFARGVEALRLPGRQRDALDEFLEAARIRPNFTRAWFEAGKLTGWWKGNLRDGIAYVERAQTLYAEAVAHGEAPDPALSAEIDRELERLRKDYAEGTR